MPKNGGNRTVHDLSFRHEGGAKGRVELVRLRELRSRSLDHSIHQLTRPAFHVLMLCIEGEGAHRVDFQRVALVAGDVLHVRPGQIHAFEAGLTNEALLLLFRPQVLPPGAVPPEVDPLRARPWHPRAEDFDRLCRMCEAIGALEGPTDLDLVPAAERLLHAAWTLVEQFRPRGEASEAPTPARLRQVRAFERSVLAHLVEHRGLGWHAARIGVSTRSLGRACHAVLGTSPKQHLDALVALEAQRELAHADDSIERIAERLGFSEPSNFTKFFVRTTGRTPRSFRGGALK